MPPKRKRKSEHDAQVSTDEENEVKQNATSQRKRGKLQDSSSAGHSNVKFDLEWSEHGEPGQRNIRPLYYLTSKSLPGCSKIAAFDIDFTVIVTKSGRKFPTGKFKSKIYLAVLNKRSNS